MMSPPNKDIVLAFDAYGTLLSTESIAEKLAEHFGQEKAQGIAAKWRLYQLEYTWRLNSMNQYEPFSTVTQRALQHALKEAGVSLEAEQIDNLMHAYDSLSTFPDVDPALRSLRGNPSITCVVFSNGTYAMVNASVTKSPDLAPHASIFKDIVVVEEVRKFKPAPEVYTHLIEKVGKTKEQVGEVWLISGNPFDIVGAVAVGMKAVWVDRSGAGWVDTLGGEGEKGRPTVVVRDLGEVVDAVLKFSEA